MTDVKMFHPPIDKYGEPVYPGDVLMSEESGHRFTVEAVIYRAGKAPMVSAAAQGGKTNVELTINADDYVKTKRRPFEDVIKDVRHYLTPSEVRALVFEAYEAGRADR